MEATMDDDADLRQLVNALVDEAVGSSELTRKQLPAIYLPVAQRLLSLERVIKAMERAPRRPQLSILLRRLGLVT